jgi:group I intron endonuclease
LDNKRDKGIEVIAGIYYIINKLNGHKYIGSSVDIETRWKQHKCMLRGDCHDNSHLQRAWDKYGENAFEFKIMAYTDPDKAVVLEEFMLQNYFDRFEYNIAESAVAPMLGREHTEEAKQKMSESHIGKIFSEEHKQKMSEALSGKNHPLYGKRRSEETKLKISKAQSGENGYWFGETFSEEHKQKLSEAHAGENNSFYGRYHTEEAKRKMSKAHSGEKHPNWIDIPEEEIMAMKSLREQGYYYRQIADIFGVSKNTVSRRLNVN